MKISGLKPLAAFLVLSDCASVETTELHDIHGGEMNKVATVTSLCDSYCKSAIYNDSGFDGKDGSSFVRSGLSIGNATIQSVNGVVGATSRSSNCGASGVYNVFNNGWSWDFVIEVLPGPTVLRTFSAGCTNQAHTQYDINVHLKAGHRYAFLLVKKVVDNGDSYGHDKIEWYPVMYDYNDSSLVLSDYRSRWLVQ